MLRVVNLRVRVSLRSEAVRFVAVALINLSFFVSAQAQSSIQLHDITRDTGITFRHTNGGCGHRYIMETMTGGVALFDYDGDGYTDVYFLNGAPLPGTKVDVVPKNALYRNEGGCRFTDVTEEAGVGDTGYGLGVAAADYDNDGNLDLYVNNFGPNVLYRNNGDGTFTDVTDRAGVESGNRVGAGTCFLDIDADGDLDLYVSNYVTFSYATHVDDKRDGIPWIAGPRDYPPERDVLYRNNGDGTFTDVSVESGVAACAGTGMGMVAADYDDDGDTDIFVVNDNLDNFLFENDGHGRFEQVGLLTGTACNAYGDANASMGVDAGDYDNDGRLDFFMTSYQGELPVLYRNLGDRLFEDATLAAGAGSGSLPHVNWGTGFVDFDNDGDRDLFIACGHLLDTVEQFDDTAKYEVRNILLMNTGDGKFSNVSDSSGNGLAVRLSSRGTGFDDLDNDGDVDAVILNLNREPTVLRNDSNATNHWLQIRLRGTTTNRDGVGARVKVFVDDLTLTDEVHSGRGYQSHHGMLLHVGIGQRNHVDRIEVRWVGGGIDVFEDPCIDRLVTIQQGQGRNE